MSRRVGSTANRLRALGRNSVGYPEAGVLLAGLCLVVLVVGTVAWLANVATYDVAVAIVIFVAIVVVSIPVLRRLAEAEADERLFWILLVALLAKLIFSLVRYFVIFKVYNGLGDAARYDQDGWALADAIRSGEGLPQFAQTGGADEVGTARVVQLTGYVYVVIGRSQFGAFFLYSWMAFWGLILFLRGARWGFPEIDRRRLTCLVMFFPSLLFWPSSIGKDAVMVFLLGLAVYGAGRLLGPRPNLLGAVPFVAALGGMLLIRPHVGLMAVLAIAVAMVFAVLGGGRKATTDSRGRGFAVRVVALVVLVAAAIAASSQTARFFSETAGEAVSTEDAFDLTLRRTQVGDSKFEPVVVRTPADIPMATLSVLYRPFVWEVRNVANLIAAGESMVLAVLTLLSLKRLRRWPGSAWRRPFVIFCTCYALMFVVAFSNIANVGILARQRTQMIPFFLLFLAIPADKWWQRESPDGDAEPTPIGSQRVGEFAVRGGASGPTGPAGDLGNLDRSTRRWSIVESSNGGPGWLVPQ